ncbi:NrfD/PsrC family molybdoenzyme membrane anchor subunit [Musicola paradisiaca]|uniref:Polysulphide reductase NrfD n=1 Tax=Musicola paradisiaca (strain Ech703) TaxID=579405 RepID=C6CDQ2_MUSP7|nr:NrfD/PsrC family molybdoenzyme membrane anchor subunit [Musicola paradisiaca]ACS85169.1 Polysulphide reductase NrfD [Musicola paradisiaca Ech703]
MINNAFHFDTLVWDWPIAIYLFVLGIASGMVIIALGLQRHLPAEQRLRFQYRAAVGAPLMVAIGLTLLVFHLTRPLSFWYVMRYYNPGSVMSLGVMLFQIFFLALAFWWLQLGRHWLMQQAQRYRGGVGAALSGLGRLGNQLDRHARQLNGVLALLAVLLGVYTGFLLSTLKGFPLLNNGLLPVLFLNSGVISGLAVLSLCHACSASSPETARAVSPLLHRIERGCLLLEALLLTAFFFGLYTGGGAKTDAAVTALQGFWGGVFWIGVAGIGIVLPLLLSLRRHTGRYATVVMAVLALLSVLSFRFFILYAGQMVTA